MREPNAKNPNLRGQATAVEYLVLEYGGGKGIGESPSELPLKLVGLWDYNMEYNMRPYIVVLRVTTSGASRRLLIKNASSS